MSKKKINREFEDERLEQKEREQRNRVFWVCEECGEEFRSKIYACPICGSTHVSKQIDF